MIYLITGGTGSLGTALARRLLKEGHHVRTLSRNEHSIETMERSIDMGHRHRLSTFCGDVRDKDRLIRAARGADYIIHAAALKVIGVCEYNPREACLTNIIGSLNVIDAAMEADVKRAILVSTDKAVTPINLYGMTKGCAEKLFLSANRYCGQGEPKFLAVRYGNVWASRGSVAYAFRQQAQFGVLQVTHKDATRFHWTLDDAVQFVLNVLHEGKAETISVPKLPAYCLNDLAWAFQRRYKLSRAPEYMGLRPGEKLHESMVSQAEAHTALEGPDRFILHPGRTMGTMSTDYSSGRGPFLTREQLDVLVGGVN